uniref:Methyltransf_21 domain-containing protein n=1 Tax=Caenorhabditis japonica TaxID=281687 RepID=A0A8R1DR94_CAEJA
MAPQLTVHTLVLFVIFGGNVLLKRNFDSRDNVESLHESAECVQKTIEPLMTGDLWRYWDRFAYIVNKCSPTLKDVELGSFPNTDEFKYHYLPLKKVNGCSIVSLGIGKDVKAEKKMSSVMPECEFYGADPVNEDNNELFSAFGNFYNMAVGDKNGSFRSYVLEEIYRYQEVATIDLATFLRNNVKQKLIDQLMVDIEHAEYPVFPFFEENGQLEEWGIHVCQINIEIHSPTAEDRQTFATFLKKNFLNHQWIFINSELHPSFKHIRLFMVNARSRECLQRYFVKNEKTKNKVTKRRKELDEEEELLL